MSGPWRLRAALGSLFVLPALLFIPANILKYELHRPALFDALGPLTDPGSGLLRLLVDLLVVGGPLVAVVLVLPRLVRLQHRSGVLSLDLRLQPALLAVGCTAIALGGMIAAYLLGENLL